MAERKRNWFKELLEWLHHAYWISEFIVSCGFWGFVVTWTTRHIPVIRDYKWFLIALLVGTSMYLLGLLHKEQQRREETRENETEEKLGSNIAQATTDLPNAGSNVRTNALLRAISAEAGIFNSEEYFRTAYYSVLQDVASNAYRHEAERVRPEDKESFYLDVLGIGTVAYRYDVIWWPLFRSQHLALLELNRTGGITPKSTFQRFFDEAVRDYPKEYDGVKFEDWIGYLEKNTLLKVHRSDMVEITVQGKDFLKYLLHTGRSPETKRM